VVVRDDVTRHLAQPLGHVILHAECSWGEAVHKDGGDQEEGRAVLVAPPFPVSASRAVEA
jgi:hypothetical protein